MLTWWDGSHWTDRRTPIPGGPLDPSAVSRPTTDEGELTGALGDDADRPGENSGPIPVVTDADIDDSGDAVFADPTSVFAPVGPEAWSSTAGEPSSDYDRGPAEPDTDEHGRPRLWLVLLPLLFIALAAGALLATSGNDDDGDDVTDTDTSDQVVTIAEAVEVAEEDGLPVDLASSTVGSLIDDICDSAGNPGSETSLSLRIAQLPIQADQVNPLLNALGKGAAVRCPDDIASDSGLLLRAGELAIQSLGPVTSTTLPTVTSEVAAPVTEDTTAPAATTATTRKPTTPTTKAPPATAAPTTTIAPTTTAACNANYSKCLRGSGPYTCIGDSDDPDFRPFQPGATAVSGPFNVTGSDPFDLDVDGNGVACQRA